MRSILIIGLAIGLYACNVEEKAVGQRKIARLELSKDSYKQGSTVVLSKAQCTPFFRKDLDKKFNLLANNKLIPVQFDDLDSDGLWDEMAFIIDFEVDSNIVLSADTVGDLVDFDPTTHVRLAYSPTFSDTFDVVTEHTRPAGYVAENDKWLYQYEGIGWENDKVAFRHYFDSRNGKDIFGKKTTKLILDTIGLPRHTPEGDYHKELWWGMDVLKVGPSLGAGGIGLLQGDSLYRLGQTATAHYTLITEGPVRSIFKITYTGWNVQNIDYTVTETITIWKGNYWYSNQLDISPKPEGNLVAGLVTMKTEKTPLRLKRDKWSAVISHDVQSENKDALGMALFVSTENTIGFGDADRTISDVSNTTFIKLTGDNKYYFLAGWEGSDVGFADSAFFVDHVIKEANQVLGR